MFSVSSKGNAGINAFSKSVQIGVALQKLLEKQRVQNCFVSYEVHVGHIFYNVNATVSFRNLLILSMFKFQNFSLDRLTDGLTD